MKNIFYFIFSTTFLTSCISSCVTSTTEAKPPFDSVAYYRHQVDSLKLDIIDLYDQLDASQDAIQLREGEISYWGHKYDSCMMILQKKKK